jgi:hypothetical protein
MLPKIRLFSKAFVSGPPFDLLGLRWARSGTDKNDDAGCRPKNEASAFDNRGSNGTGGNGRSRRRATIGGSVMAVHRNNDEERHDRVMALVERLKKENGHNTVSRKPKTRRPARKKR